MTKPALKNEKGAILPFVALVLLLLLGLASFAVDLGWFYLNSTRVQRAAESAALAGVIHMPQAYTTKAEPTAVQVAATNGYTTAPTVPRSPSPTG